jgi:hypothetical protein
VADVLPAVVAVFFPVPAAALFFVLALAAGTDVVARFGGTLASAVVPAAFFAAAGTARFAAAFAAVVVAALAVALRAGAALAALATVVFSAVLRAFGSAMSGHPHMQNGRAAGAAHSE